MRIDQKIVSKFINDHKFAVLRCGGRQGNLVETKSCSLLQLKLSEKEKNKLIKNKIEKWIEGGKNDICNLIEERERPGGRRPWEVGVIP